MQNIEVLWTQLYSAVLEVIFDVDFFDRLKADPVYNTRAVVQRTGVPADTFRAWERRYGLPSPSRTPGNQRLYSEQDVALITWLRDRTCEGITISQAVLLFRQEQGRNGDRLAQVHWPSRSGQPVNGRPADAEDAVLTPFRESITEALVAFDAAMGDCLVEEALALVGVESVCQQILQPVLHQIGERWAKGEVGISAEHYASHFVSRKLGTLFNLSRPEEGRGPLVAACLEGEMHEIGLLLTSHFLSRRGYGIVYLGANLPLDDLLEAIRRVTPTMVLMSTSTDLGARRLAAASAELLRFRHGSHQDHNLAFVGFGGSVYVANPRLREDVKGMFLGTNAAEAITAVDQLFSTMPRIVSVG